MPCTSREPPQPPSSPLGPQVIRVGLPAQVPQVPPGSSSPEALGSPSKSPRGGASSFKPLVLSARLGGYHVPERLGLGLVVVWYLGREVSRRQERWPPVSPDATSRQPERGPADVGVSPLLHQGWDHQVGVPGVQGGPPTEGVGRNTATCPALSLAVKLRATLGTWLPGPGCVRGCPCAPHIGTHVRAGHPCLQGTGRARVGVVGALGPAGADPPPPAEWAERTQRSGRTSS